MDQVILAKNLHWKPIEIYEKKFQLKRAIENNAHGLFANMRFLENEDIFSFKIKNIVTHPTYLTVQLDDQVHFSLDPDFLQYINHSCDPNIFMDISNQRMIALKDIKKGEELNFFYPSTEWDMSQAFICNCGSTKCQRYIGGAITFKPETILQYRLNNYIKRKISEASETI